MMDTVLNLGLNDETVQAIARESGDERFAYDSYRRFIQMYSDVVLGLITVSSRKFWKTGRPLSASMSTRRSLPTTGRT